MPTVVENCPIQRYPGGEEQGVGKDVRQVLGGHSVSFSCLFACDGGVSVYARLVVLERRTDDGMYARGHA